MPLPPERSDPGYGLLMHEAAAQADEMTRAGRMSVQFLDDADHTFTNQAPRHALIRAVAEHLSRRYLPK